MDVETAIKLAVFFLVAIFFAVRAQYLTHYTRRTPLTRIKYGIAAVLFALYFANVFDFAQMPFSWRVRGAGILVIGTGFALFFWAHAHLGINWSPVIEKRFAKTRHLVTSGPYQYIRHPIYTASFIVLIGFLLFSGNLILTGVPLVILTLFYLIKIPREEDELVRNFGTRYTNYMRKTGRLVPRLALLSDP